MLTASEDDVPADIREEDTNQRERPVDVDVQRSAVGNAVHDANACPF